MKKSKQEHVHAEGLVEVCDLPGFRGTPKELHAIRSSLSRLTQVKRTDDGLPIAQIVNGTLFVEFNLGDVDAAQLPTIASYACSRVAAKAKQALQLQKLTRVK